MRPTPTSRGAPGGSVAVGNRKLTVTWQRPNPDSGSLVHGYTVRHKQSGAADSAYVETKVYPRPGLASGSVELTGLTADTAYVVQIRSHNANGDSPWVTIGGTHTVGPFTLVSNLLISPGRAIPRNPISCPRLPSQAFMTGNDARRLQADRTCTSPWRYSVVAALPTYTVKHPAEQPLLQLPWWAKAWARWTKEGSELPCALRERSGSSAAGGRHRSGRQHDVLRASWTCD